MQKSSRQLDFGEFVGATLFALLSLLVFFYWAGFPLLNTKFVHGYPKFQIPPSPNVFQSSRYGGDWWPIWVLTLNGLLPLVFMIAVMENRARWYATVHWGIAWLMLIVSPVALLWMWIVRVWWICNSSGSAASTACNDYRWCGVYFAANPVAQEWCPNVAGYTPAVTMADLHVNPEYTQHIIFAGVFTVAAFFHLFMNVRMARSGIFSNFLK